MKQLRKFLSMINFYRKFIPSCIQTLRPLINLLSATKSETTLFVDASSTGCKAVLQQKVHNTATKSFHQPSSVTLLLTASSWLYT